MARKTITTNTTTSLGDSGAGTVTTKVIQITGAAWTVGTLVLQGRLAGTSDAFVAIPYRRRFLNGAVSDDQIGSAAITADSLIEVNAAGLEVAFLSATITATKIDVDFVDLTG